MSCLSLHTVCAMALLKKTSVPEVSELTESSQGAKQVLRMVEPQQDKLSTTFFPHQDPKRTSKEVDCFEAGEGLWVAQVGSILYWKLSHLLNLNKIL